jgi:hypothetical protein
MHIDLISIRSFTMKKILSLLTIGSLLLFASQVLANELLVLSGDKSQNSKRWKEEVLPQYPDSRVGKQLPAKIVVIHGAQFPEWLDQALENGRVGEIFGTPTFIIWDPEKNREVGRVEGYTQKERFYAQLDEAVTMIAQGKHPGKREGSGSHHQDEEGSESEHQPEGSGSDHHPEGSGSEGQPDGSELSRDIMDHMYKTPEEAKRASELLGFGGEIHTHESPQGTIYMPGPMM